MPNEKIKLTKEEFESMYQIEETTEVPTEKETQEEQFLTDEQEEQDTALFDNLPNMENIE